ncbi:hypothetical protein ACFXHD_11500 [Streptomyces hydrogenans]|uniref:hypothetical protein n=1 Tax=Streptomyces hydrogenans TaxID=1873719 RepID=UPI0036950941
MLALTGCGTADDDAKSSPPTTPAATTTPVPAPSITTAGPQAAEKKAVLTVYSAMWAEQMKAYVKADAKGTWLCRRERESFANGFGSHCVTPSLDQCRCVWESLTAEPAAYGRSSGVRCAPHSSAGG